jgi:hypothetical protein
LSGSAPSRRDRFSAVFITNIAESRFSARTVEEEIRKRGYSIESMLPAADAATTWDKDQAWDMVRAALERQHPKSSS